MSYLGRLNSLLTSTTSRYDSLRRNILSSSAEDDTNITDPSSSHVSRVLRAYYTEKARPFPDWLGPDPRDVARAQQNTNQTPYTANRPVGSLRSNASTGAGVGAGGLSDLWNDGGQSGGGGQGQEGGLRRGAGAGAGAGRRPGLQGMGGSGQGDAGPGAGGGGLNPRPLPSQRAGSHQTQGIGLVGGRTASPVPPGSSAGVGGGAAERLKARLNRGGSGRSVNEGVGGQGRDDGSAGGGSYATQGLSGWQGRR